MFVPMVIPFDNSKPDDAVVDLCQRLIEPLIRASLY